MIFNKRNALIGFLTLEVLKRRRRRRELRRRAPKIALFSVLGLATLGAAIAAFALLRRRGEDDLSSFGEDESEIVGEYVTGGTEPIPAT
jgi:hypothetical protein